MKPLQSAARPVRSIFYLCLLAAYLWSGVALAAGALAIDENQGDQWGWAVDYATTSQAEARALKECGKNCRIVKRFSRGCAAYVADQAPGSTVYGWGTADTDTAARQRAHRECRDRGGSQCTSRAWGCNSSRAKEPEPEDHQDRKKPGANDSGGQAQTHASLLMLIDTSGSMNESGKLAAAKEAAIGSIRASLKDGVEIAVLAFSGGCDSPVPRRLDFTTDRSRLNQFINSLQASGGTPLGPALEIANHYMNTAKASHSSTEMVLLLADGDNNCGDVESVMAKLKAQGIIFRHETVGLDIAPNSAASRKLQAIATASGGTYHYAENHAQLASSFNEAIETMSMLDMLGTFGRPAPKSQSPGRQQQAPDSSMQKLLDSF